MKKITTVLLLIFCQISVNASVVRYWIDKDINNAKTIYDLSGLNDLGLPVSDIDEGYHLLTLQLSEDEITWSVPYSFYFSKCRNDITEFEYILDTNDHDSKLNVTEGGIDVSGISAGMHNITIYSSEGFIPPVSAFFYKTPSMGEINIKMYDNTQNLISSVKRSPSDSSFDMDVSSLKTGYNPVSLVCFNSRNEQLFSGSYLINKIPDGGSGIKRIDYTIEPGTGNRKQISFSESSPEFSYSGLLDISGFEYSPQDACFYINGREPYTSPRANLHLFAVDAKGFVLDSIVPFIDKYREEKLEAPLLSHNKQYDFPTEMAHSAWVSFLADPGDVINFRARRDCDVTLYSPDADYLNDTTLSVKNDNVSYSLARNGRHYLKLTNIKPSNQIFSVKAKYLTGNHHEESDTTVIPSFPDFDGTLISWKDGGEWIDSDSILEYSSEYVDIRSSKSGIRRPRLSSGADLAIPFDRSFSLKFDKFVTKVVFVPSSPNLLNNTSLSPSIGQVESDSIYKVAIWTGFEDKIDFKVTDDTDSISDLSKFYFRKLYVTFSEIDSDTRFTVGTPSDSFDGSTYTHLYIWHDTDKDCYKIADLKSITFNEDALILASESEDISYPLNKNYIITYEYHENDGISPVGNDLKDEALISINNGMISFHNLPNHVTIYDVKGIEYFSRFISDDEFCIPVDRLGKGVYIIRVGNRTAKIML